MAHNQEDIAVKNDATGEDSKGYIAFISYSHADEKIAAITHKLLENFRVPHALIGRVTENGKVPARIRPVFRDQEEFSASADLGQAIRKALAVSRSLVVICSPRSAKSRWVGEEIRYFKALGGSKRIYCLIIDGNPDNASKGSSERASFHPALFEEFDNQGKRIDGQGIEPLAMDLSECGISIAGIKLIAGILGVGYDDLYQRVRRQKLRNRSLIAGLIAIVFAAGALLFVDGQREKQLNHAQQLAVNARQEVYTTQPLAGLALAMQALTIAPRRDEAGRQVVVEIARDLASRGRVAWLGNDVENIVHSLDGSRLAVDHATAKGELRSGLDGELLQEFRKPIYVANFLNKAPGYLVVDYRGYQAELLIATSGTRVAELKSPVSSVTFGLDLFFVSYSGGYRSELRRISDGAIVPLAKKSQVQQVVYSLNAKAPLIIVEYFSDHHPELRRADDSSLIKLADRPTKIAFSPDIDNSRTLVTYKNAPAELLRTADLSLVHRFEDGLKSLSFLSGSDGNFIIMGRDGAVKLFRSLDGSLVLTGEKIVRSRAKTHFAVLANNHVDWFSSQGGVRLGSLQGDFKDIKFSRDRPSSRMALQRGNGWELRSIEDGTLVDDLTEAENVDLDVEFLLVKQGENAEIHRLFDGSVVLSLGKRVKSVKYPSSGLVEVSLDNGLTKLRRLSDGAVIEAPASRSIIKDEIVGKGSEYQLISHVNGVSELSRTVDGKTLLQFARLHELTFVPESEPSHVLANFEDGSSSLIALKENGNAISLNGRAVSVDIFPAKAPRYLIVRYDDGRAEIWSGMENIRRLGALETNLQGYSLADNSSALTVWYANGRAEVFDLEWLMRASEDDVSDEQLFTLACGAMLNGFDASKLAEQLDGNKWIGCAPHFND